MRLRGRSYSSKNLPPKIRVLHKTPKQRISDLLLLNHALDPGNEAVILDYTPTKTRRPTIQRLQNLSPQKIIQTSQGHQTSTPRKRLLYERAAITLSTGEKCLLTPTNENPPILSYNFRNSQEPFMPAHDSTLVEYLDICLSYEDIIKHQEYLKELKTHRQSPEGPKIFKGSAHQKIQEASPDEAPPTLHWCHILAQSLKKETQFPENFLIGTPQANAAMLLFEVLIPEFLKKKHQEQGSRSNPCFYIDLRWSYANAYLRIGKDLIYRIKDTPGPNPPHFIEKTFSMMSPITTPFLAIGFTEAVLNEAFKHLNDPAPSPPQPPPSSFRLRKRLQF